MADSIQKIRVEGGKEAEAAIQGVQTALENFNKTASKNRDAVRLLDKATGGAITKFQDFQKGISQGITTVKGLSKTFKGLRVAIAATGIGLIVVALGTIATYWEDITGFISGATAELERQREELERTKKLLNDEVDLLNSQLRLQELKGESTDETLLTLRKTLLIQQEIVKAELLENQALLEKQKARDNEITFFDKLKASFDVRKGYNYQENLARIESEKKASQTEEQIELEDKINQLKKEQFKIDTSLTNLDIAAEKRTQKKLDDEKKVTEELRKQRLEAAKEEIKLEEEIAKALIVSKEDKRQAELQAIRKYYEDLQFELIMAGELDAETELALNEAKRQKLKDQQAVFDEEDQTEKDKENEEFEKQRVKRIDDAKAELEAVKELEEKKQKFALDTLDNASKIAGEETKLGKALLVAKQLLVAQQFLIDIGALKAKATVVSAQASLESAEAGVEIGGSVAKAANTAPPPGNIPFILSAIATGAGIISSIMSAVKSTKAAASAAGGASTATPTIQAPVQSAPAFNIVGQNETSQLAETIAGANQEPMRAYVVSNDITTAQSLDRNIVQGATIG